MNTEIIKIIEGGIKGDKEKVINYSKVLSNNLKLKGDERLANRILKVISQNNSGFIGMDSLGSKPVDQESRLEIVDITMPYNDNNKLFFNSFIEEEICDFIKSFEMQDELKKFGIHPDNTLLLYGPPGCGKTSLTKYLSYKTDLPLITARLDVLLSSLLGSTAKNIRKIFDYASKRPCILFLDEFDAIAKVRDDKNELGELKRVVNSLLQNIDEFSENSILVAATNHHEVLDKAIWRRFTKVLELDKPSKEVINEIIYNMITELDIKLDVNEKKWIYILNVFEGLSPADIKTILNTVVKKSILNNSKSINLISIIYESYLFKKHSVKDENELIRYLNDNGATQKEISDFLKISLRKVREVL
ncbi:AAA family ATPase [Clostridium perfringens]|uniref:AAA family ATPase n=1 Tax=Clostridium perfringens TaxID=1502 RepID=UPI001CB49FB8|nr:AAA family ATPase [Clostridium perfringens]ELQ0171337.1 AAA family ATPase [Clostridium perfringens]MDK0634799.1 ATP-binding protein [Clostridium perfringens]MDU3845919.1 ATP-binding protein [Clostridium perfringens]HBI7093778.1 AAA family ATPase [Clostridium perfringens]